MSERRRRNDLRQYDDLAAEWWRPDGAFAALHWLARARGALVPAPSRPDAALLDLGCGEGCLLRTSAAIGTSASICPRRRWRSPRRMA